MKTLFVLAVMLIVVIGIFVSIFDRKRVAKYFSNRGEVVLDITWKLFGKGWASEAGKEGGGNRIYKVTFTDIYGNKKQAWCKTAMLSGVYMTDEKIIEPAKVEGRIMSDAEKVALLEDEIRKLKMEQNG